jgi:hypothetical protein
MEYLYLIPISKDDYKVTSLVSSSNKHEFDSVKSSIDSKNIPRSPLKAKFSIMGIYPPIKRNSV